MTITRKLFDVKRFVLGALLALGVAGVALTALPADHASATEQRNCYPRNFTSDNQCVPH